MYYLSVAVLRAVVCPPLSYAILFDKITRITNCSATLIGHFYTNDHILAIIPGMAI